MIINGDVINQRLERIEKMQGSDPGFALLSVMAFFESLFREMLEDFSSQSSMPDLLQKLREHGSISLLPASPPRKTSGFPSETHGFARELLHFQKLANSVRHHFARVSREELYAAMYRLFDFLESLDVRDEQLDMRVERLYHALEVWKGSRSHYEDFQELLDTGFRLTKIIQENSKLKSQLSTAINEGSENELFLAANPGNQDTEADVARRYIGIIERLSHYSRSRKDFERRLIEPGPEQRKVLERIRDSGDFLLTGAAGTGKTLVLLMALKQNMEFPLQENLFGSRSSGVALLTYTGTLKKYSSYLAELLRYSSRSLSILTVDSFLNSALENHLPDRIILYEDPLIKQLFQECYDSRCGLSPEQAWNEIELYIFAHGISREDYIEGAIQRRGRPIRLNMDQRQILWRMAELFAEHMEDSHRYSRNFARFRLLEILENKLSRGIAVAMLSRIFVDEIQDLSLCDIRCLRLLSSEGLVMAGDRDQSIFLSGFAFSDAGVQVSHGRSAILKHNYRNSHEILQFVKGFQIRDTGDELHTFRHGPPVEHIREDDAKLLEDRLVERLRLLVKILGYSPESICVTAPTGRILRQISDKLENEGFDAVSIKSRDFDFGSSPGIRLSTLHSIKGLDFAAVLLYLPEEFPGLRNHDTDLIQNLLYVAATRAMEVLWLFTGPASHQLIPVESPIS